jgi:hypothetical protein
MRNVDANKHNQDLVECQDRKRNASCPESSFRKRASSFRVNGRGNAGGPCGRHSGGLPVKDPLTQWLRLPKPSSVSGKGLSHGFVQSGNNGLLAPFCAVQK